MYYYLFDQRASKNISKKRLGQIKSWIKTSKVAGEQLELASPQQITEKAMQIAQKHKAATLVVIGDDLSLDLAITGVQRVDLPSTLGYIPTTPSSGAELLGIKNWKHACKILEQRKTNDFNLFKVNDYLILSTAKLSLKAKKQSSELIKSLVLLDGKLKINVPIYRLNLSNLLNQADYHEHPATCLLETFSLPKLTHKLKAKVPIILTNLGPISETEEILMRLPLGVGTITPAHTMLLNNLVPLSGQIKISKHTKAQSMIVARVESPHA